VDLRLGVTADYGLTNIKKSTNPFVAPTDVQQLGEYVADKVSYSGVLNGDQTGSRIAPLAVKGYLGLRIKLGGLKQREEPKEDEYSGRKGCCPDTIIINLKKDTIVINFPGGQAPQAIPNPYYPQQAAPQQPAYHPDNNPYSTKTTYKPIGAIPAWYVPDEGENLNDPEQLKQAKARINQIIDDLEESIYFDLNKSDLKQKSIEVLDRKLQLMKKYPDLVISLVGHTCDLGKDGYNDELSFRRSDVARLYLISHGISSRRLIDIPMGEKYPSYPNTTEYYRSLNRRVNFRVAE
jgi:outer membrane protein OmpA-like peptidoglycan-associated protein